LSDDNRAGADNEDRGDGIVFRHIKSNDDKMCRGIKSFSEAAKGKEK